MQQQRLLGFSLLLVSTICLSLMGFRSASVTTSPNSDSPKKVIAALLDSFNAAAARADFNGYFSFYTEDAIFTGTDATERWEKPAFMKWAKPYFDRKTAWSFKAIDRHIYLDKTGKLAWFDELLDTQMKICRGSGVLVLQGKQWKIAQYILSTTVPNEQIDSVTKWKAPIEDALIKQLKSH